MSFDFQDWVLRFGDTDGTPLNAPAWFRWGMSFGASMASQTMANGCSPTLIVTTPCDSAIAGTIALGAILNQVPLKRTSLNSGDLFDQFMAAKPGTKVKRLQQGAEKRLQKYLLLTERSEERGIAMRKVSGSRKGGINYMMRSFAKRYAFEDPIDNGERTNRTLAPHVGVSLLRSLLGESALTRDWQVNLKSAVICTPTQGAAALRRETDAIMLSDLIDERDVEEDEEADDELNSVRRLTLSDLLSVSQWRPISDRECPECCQFVNASTTKPDDIPIESELVVFNGPDAYLRLNNRFKKQSQIVVISRNADPNKLERFMSVIHSVRESSSPIELSLTEPPTGIQVNCLGNRVAKEKQW